MEQRLAIIGAGGFAREVAWMVRDINAKSQAFDLRGFVVSDLSLLGSKDSHDMVLGDFNWLQDHQHEFDALVLGIGNPGIKQKLAMELLQRFPAVQWPSLIHPTAQLDLESASVGKGVVICASTIATVNVSLGDFCMVNLMCTIGHESHIGAFSVLNPSVNVSGGVRIGSGVLIGTGAQVLQYVQIGDNATVGAGAVASKDVEPGQTVIGSLARPIFHRPTRDTSL